MEWEQWQREKASADSDSVWMGMHAATANTIARTIIPVMQKEHFAEIYHQLQEREEERASKTSRMSGKRIPTRNRQRARSRKRQIGEWKRPRRRRRRRVCRPSRPRKRNRTVNKRHPRARRRLRCAYSNSSRPPSINGAKRCAAPPMTSWTESDTTPKRMSATKAVHETISDDPNEQTRDGWTCGVERARPYPLPGPPILPYLNPGRSMEKFHDSGQQPHQVLR